MKFTRLSNTRISIYLTREDVEQERIDIAEFYANEVDVKERLSHVLSVAEREMEFCVQGFGLEIEMIPIIDGELLIGISKTTQAMTQKTYIEGQTQIFSFEDFEKVIEVSHKLLRIYCGGSSLYKLDDIYFLVLYPHITELRRLKDIRAILGEFGDNREEEGPRENFLKEHGEEIVPVKALEKIGAYFNKK